MATWRILCQDNEVIVLILDTVALIQLQSEEVIITGREGVHPKVRGGYVTIITMTKQIFIGAIPREVIYEIIVPGKIHHLIEVVATSPKVIRAITTEKTHLRGRIHLQVMDTHNRACLILFHGDPIQILQYLILAKYLLVDLKDLLVDLKDLLVGLKDLLVGLKDLLENPVKDLSEDQPIGSQIMEASITLIIMCWECRMTIAPLPRHKLPLTGVLIL